MAIGLVQFASRLFTVVIRPIVGWFVGWSVRPSLNARSTRLMAIGLVSLLSIVNPFFFFALYLSSFFSFFFHLHLSFISF